jgi:hypothetical protein
MGKYFAASGDGNYNDYSFLDMAVAHETGHQWWYVLVGNNEFMEPMMDESITVYSTAYYFEKRYGKYDQQGTLMQFRSMGRMYGDLSSTFDMSVDKYKDFSDYVSTIYSRAPVVFEDLRHQTSEDTFVKILKTYFERYEYKNGSINAFLNIIGEIAGDKVKENIKTSITSPNYSPKDLQLTQEEKIEMNRQMYKKSLQEQENIYGLNLSSILLKGLNGETIYIVKPSNMTESEKLAFDMNINPMIDGMKKAYGIKFVAKSASELTETEKSGNLILFGNASTNKVISEMQDGFPVIISTKGLIMDDLAVITNNASGIFTVKNPKDNTKVVLVYFWYQNMRDYYLFDGGSANQFIININDKKVISGKF